MSVPPGGWGGPPNAWGVPGPAPEPAPDDSFGLAIAAIAVAASCGCLGLPVAIVGMVNATRVKQRWAQGDRAGAEEAARKARSWSMASFWVTFGGFVLVIVFYLVLIAVSASTD